MERLKHIKDTLVSCIESQMGDLKNVEAKELGEVVDMVKDMEEAMYYCTITKAMEEKAKEEKECEKHKYFHEPQMKMPMQMMQPQYMPMPMYYPPQQEEMMMFQDMDRNLGRMYYGGPSSYAQGGNSSGGGSSSYARGGGGYNSSARGNNARGGGSRGFYEMGMEDMMSGYPSEMMRDAREGRSPMSRRNYMESKEMHQGVPKQMQELEKYLKELTEDLTEMIEDASPEEKQVLQQKLSNLATKIK